MDDKELQRIWKKVEVELTEKSKNELNLLLSSKAEQTLGKFRLLMSISMLTSTGLLFFLAFTAYHRQSDVLYLINNATLATITLSGLIIGILSFRKMQNKAFNQPLKSWLEVRINLLSKWLTGRYSKSYLYVTPFLYLLIVLSIHVYFEKISFIETFNSEESIIGIIVGTPIGLFVSYYAMRKIRKYQIKKLEFLQDLLKRLYADN